MNTDIKPILDQPPLPTRALWRALLAIHNHFLVEKLTALRLPPEVQAIPPHVVDAMRLLDCWLDTAIDNDWFGGEDSED